MNVESLKLSNDTKKLIKTIQLRMELHEHQQFRVHKDFGQVVALLKAASLSQQADVISAYREFIRSLDAEKIGFFKVLGAISDDVARDAMKSPSQKNATSTAQGEENVRYDENGRKLRRMVYRGRERWV